MKKLFIVILLSFGWLLSYASHLKGGWIQYEYLGAGAAPNTSKYRITVRQYLDYNSSYSPIVGQAQVDNNIFVGIFKGDDNSLYINDTIPLELFLTDKIKKSTFDPCLSPIPVIQYRIDKYITTIDLPNSTAGYTIAVQRCCRISGIVNLTNSDMVGITYSNKIPGIINGIDFSKNSSPAYEQKDTAVICYSSFFTFNFSATDVDGDSLSYSFCDGFNGGSSSLSGSRPNPASNPPYGSIPYAGVYSGLSPLGNGVSINATTGIISGIAPPITGDYVVAVCVSEFRNRVLIGSTRKEIHINIANCQLSGAQLNPTYINCNDLTLNFINQSTASNIISYLWTFGEPASGTGNTSTQASPTHIYKDAGVYTTKLKVVATGGCVDSATTQVSVFPGFVANFKIDGSCVINPYQFTDLTVSIYGTVSNWTWDFGETSVATGTSTIKNPTYQYPTLGSKTATLTVKDSKGCQSVVTQTVVVFDKPTIVLPFKDTLICSIDTLQLFANSIGSFTWTPTTTLKNATTPNPYVFPKDTTTYYVTVNNNGCINTDSIKVNVLNFITVNAGLDTSICQTDTIRLRPISYALSYVWKASTGVAVDSVKNPLINPLVNTDYYVTANLGKCQAKDTVAVVVNPYPISNAGVDAAICFGNRVQLNGNIVGNSFSWSPTTSLVNVNTLTPTAGPTKTTNYILTSNNITGCLKPVSDTIIVSVIPIITVFAGRDTTVVVNQPLQLTATSTSDSSTTSFVWSPTTGLNNSNIFNPVATLNSSVDSIRYKVRATTTQGCFGEDDILVRVYKTEPDIFVPSGFTPNSDGRNDILKPIPVGITRLDYFNVYNRFGQLLYSTPEIGKGWDGNFSGSAQPSGTYVYVTQGTDYLGKIVFRKGTVVLIR